MYHNRNLQTSKSPLERKARGTSLFTRAVEANQLHNKTGCSDVKGATTMRTLWGHRGGGSKSIRTSPKHKTSLIKTYFFLPTTPYLFLKCVESEEVIILGNQV